MAEVFKRAQGRKAGWKITKVAAYHRDTQARMDSVTTAHAMRAGAILAQHRHDDHSYIEVERGKTDRFIILNDERGLKAAMSIEYGRELPGGGRTTPVGALREGVMGVAIERD